MNCRFENGTYSEAMERLPLIKKEYTWDLKSDSADIEGSKREIKALKRAFLKIQVVIPVRFHYIEDMGEITITVSASDDYFKTRPNALAYAFVGTTSQPTDLVFNESYIWVLNRETGTNRYDMEVVALHEICHVLGLSHSMNPKSIMYPNYQGILDLDIEDIERLQNIHGVRSGFMARMMKLKGYFQRIL